MEKWVTLLRNQLANHKSPTPQWGPLGPFIYYTHYSRLKPDGTKETWPETVLRVVAGTFEFLEQHCETHGCPFNEDKALRTAVRMYDAILSFKFLPPGRGLLNMGAPHVYEKGGAWLNNCGFISTVDLEKTYPTPFTWAFDALMRHVGVGFDTLGSVRRRGPYRNVPHVIHVSDSREGWVAALHEFLVCWREGHSLRTIDIDTSAIRPAGAPLSSGGVASGPQPLHRMFDKLRQVLEPLYVIQGTTILDIFTIIGEAVVAGNIRRSALIGLGHADDNKFIEAKSYMCEELAHRRMSNNSIIVTDDIPVYAMNQTKHNGEPGYFFLENARAYGRMKDGINYIDHRAVGTNPCGEQTLESYELCCLVETFPAHCRSLDEYLSVLKLAYLYAKVVTTVSTRCGYTDELFYPTDAVVKRNRRIGCSMSGIASFLHIRGATELMRWCDQAYQFIVGLDHQYSSWLRIPHSIKKTSIKPSGTVSLLPGAPPGVHFPHSRYYIRRQRLPINSPLVSQLIEHGYRVEDDYYEKGKTVVVEYPVKESNYRRGKKDVSMWEQLELAAQLQYHWADNQVSATISFKPDEASQIPYALELYRSRLKAVSFLPLDTTFYPQMVYEEISQEEYTKRLSEIHFFEPSRQGETPRDDGFCDSMRCSSS